MPFIKRTIEYVSWIKGLRDTRGAAKIFRRVRNLQVGNPGDVGSVGDGISEMRINFGPGYRVYFRVRDDTATLLYGGDKDSQERDIRKAKDIASDLED